MTLLGDPLCLACELLFRALGDLVASNALVLQTQPDGAAVLGLGHSNTGGEGIDRTTILSTKRRMVSEKCISSILTFLRVHVLDR